MNKEKMCKSYCGIACVNGNCPYSIIYYEGFTQFEGKPTCENCIYYKGCEDCYFENTDMCEKVVNKNE